MSSPTNDTSKMSAKLRSLYQSQRPEIQISLHSPRAVYTTLDRLEGVVSIVAPVDVKFDDIEIEFVGTSRTFVERVTTAAAISGRSEAFHQFLKLIQPRLEQHYPRDGIFKAGRTYEFPFLFVVPQQLLPKICQHKIISPAVRDAHLQLPPSFGDKESAEKEGGNTLDDMVPEMASIRYGIFARITKNKLQQSDEVARTTVASKALRLRVTPATPEQPPLDVNADEDDYTLRREKTIRKGVLKGKLGTLVMEASQPPALRLPARSEETDGTSPASSLATIMLRFDPADAHAQPPKLGRLVNKLKVCTFFACSARSAFPRKHNAGHDLSQGVHSEQVALSSRCMANVEWTRRDPAKDGVATPPVRRDSAFSIASADHTAAPSAGTTPAPSAAYHAGGIYYTARLLVPIALPPGSTSGKTFAPTFHSCLVSRIYQLKLELSLPGSTGTVDLRLPFQISRAALSSASRSGSLVGDAALETPVAGGTPTPPPVLEGQDPAEQEDQREGSAAADFFAPRTIHAPAGEFVGRSRIGSAQAGAAAAIGDDAPPGYSFFATGPPAPPVESVC